MSGMREEPHPNYQHQLLYQKLEITYQLMPGGRWIPLWCVPRQRIAVIVPFRARDQHLTSFVNHLHPFLRSQLLDFVIIVVEQVVTYFITLFLVYFFSEAAVGIFIEPCCPGIRTYLIYVYLGKQIMTITKSHHSHVADAGKTRNIQSRKSAQHRLRRGEAAGS